MGNKDLSGILQISQLINQCEICFMQTEKQMKQNGMFCAQSPRVMKNPNSPGGPEGGKFLPMSVPPTPPTCEAQQVVQLQNAADNVVTSQTISIIPGNSAQPALIIYDNFMIQNSDVCKTLLLFEYTVIH